jgi:hypothetical protein
MTLMLIAGVSQAQVSKFEDFTYPHTAVKERKAVPYRYIREANVKWSKRVHRVIDVREKQNIEALTNSLDKITSLNPVEFDWITSGEHCKAGFIAQEVEEVFPEFVVENMASEGQEERKGLTGGMTGGIVVHLVKAIQEQQTLIEALEARLSALEE